MKKIVLAALAATSAMVATPALAQSGASGTVSLSGTVASKCTASPDLDDDIALGELADANGNVDSAFPDNTDGLTRNFTVTCTSPNVTISADASPLVNAAIVSATTGYTNTVHYTATLAADKAGSATPVTAVDTSNVSGATATSLSGRLANAPNNVRVTVSNGNTTTASDLLEAGNYSGSIAISVAPPV